MKYWGIAFDVTLYFFVLTTYELILLNYSAGICVTNQQIWYILIAWRDK